MENSRQAARGTEERQLINKNEESDCDGKDEVVLEEVISVKHFTVKECSKIFHDIESAKDKMLEANPNLERSMTVC